MKCPYNSYISLYSQRCQENNVSSVISSFTENYAFLLIFFELLVVDQPYVFLGFFVMKTFELFWVTNWRVGVPRRKEGSQKFLLSCKLRYFMISIIYVIVNLFGVHYGG